jgi:hypothetical protein
VCIGLGSLLALLPAGCESDECGHDTGPGADAGGVQVEIGTPGGDDGLLFVPLEPGGDIALETFGQGGTHGTLAVRARGLGTNRAFLDVTMESADDGRTVSTVPSIRPQLWLCDDAREVCDYLPVHVMTGGLAAPEDKNGLRVIVSAAVRGENDRAGEGRQEGVLRQRFRDGADRADSGLPLPDAGAGDEDAGAQ